MGLQPDPEPSTLPAWYAVGTMGELLDTGLRALIAPQERVGGVGLVLSALAAAAGLAVLGITAQEEEDALEALDAVPKVSMPIGRFLQAKRLWTSSIEYLQAHWDERPPGMSVSFADAAKSVGWVGAPRDEAERAVLFDKLLERDHPFGVVATAFATNTPVIFAAPSGSLVDLYNYEEIPELMALEESDRARLLAVRSDCPATAFRQTPGQQSQLTLSTLWEGGVGDFKPI